MLLLMRAISPYILVVIMHNSFTNPNPIAIPLETERCILRELALEDTNALFALGSNPQVLVYTTLFPIAHASVDDTYTFIQDRLNKYKQALLIPWAVIEKSTNRVIGFAQLWDYKPEHKRAEIGYFLVPEYWGQGIGTEISKAIISYSFTYLQLNRLQAAADPRNISSIRVIEKCGFRYEGLLENYYIVHGECCDRKMYAMTDKEFRQLYQN